MLTVALMVGLATRAHAEDCVYDLNADFDASTIGPSNPSGEWSYDYGVGGQRQPGKPVRPCGAHCLSG